MILSIITFFINLILWLLWISLVAAIGGMVLGGPGILLGIAIGLFTFWR